MTDPYPLRMAPFFQDYLWGGRKLATALGKPLPDSGVWAESWEIIDHPEHQSRIIQGPLAGLTLHQLAADCPDWLFGSQASQFNALPLLLKYLDCQKVLSVQVHPNDDYARKMTPPDLGKTEAWYIVAAEPGARLYAGLKRGVDEKTLRQAVSTGELEHCLHEIQPAAGDCVFIPAGTVHALGAGLLVAEIQQASNTTFRLFDWNRVDAQGNARTLHVEQAIQVIDFNAGPRSLQEPQPTGEVGRERLTACDKFVLDRLQHASDIQTRVSGDAKFHLLTAPHGNVRLAWEFEGTANCQSLQIGESVLLPASMPATSVDFSSPRAVLLDMYLP